MTNTQPAAYAATDTRSIDDEGLQEVRIYDVAWKLIDSFTFRPTEDEATSLARVDEHLTAQGYRLVKSPWGGGDYVAIREIA